MTIKIGSDPEFFIQKDGELVSAIGIVGGTKEKPEVLNEYCSVHEDNVAVECSVMPSETEEDFLEHIKISITSVEQKIGNGYQLSKKASHVFKDSDLEDEGAKEAGCSVDFDATTGEENPSPNLANTNLRSCGGHVHVSYDSPNAVVSRAIVRLLDAMLGVPSVILDDDNERRSIYGKASAFRPKAYGLEYRTLSNFWTQSEDTIKWVYRVSTVATKIAVKTGGVINEDMVNEAKRIINESDQASAMEFIEKYNIELPVV